MSVPLLNVMDSFNRDCLAAAMDPSIDGAHVARVWSMSPAAWGECFHWERIRKILTAE
jgi:hypothetical protein